MRNQRRIVTLLRWVMFLALAYLVSAAGHGISALQVTLLSVIAASNIALARLPAGLWEHRALLPLVAATDLGVLTVSMLRGQGFAQDFFFAYFLLLAVVALSGTLRLAVAGTCVVIGAYGAYLGLEFGAQLFHMPQVVGRLGFLFSVGIAYGGLMEAGKARLRESALQGQLVGWVSKLSSAFADEFDAVDVIRHVLMDVQNVYPGNVRASLVQVVGDHVRVITSSDSDRVRDRALSADRYPELQRVIATGRPVCIDDIRTSPITESVREMVRDLPFTSLLLCPINLHDDNIGHIILRVARKHGAFTPAMVATTQNVAEAIAMIFRQAKMREAMERSEKMEMVSQITSSVAHSFNSILSTVLLSSETLRKQTMAHAYMAGCGTPPCDDESMQRFQAIEFAVKEGLTIVERLSAWTRLGQDTPGESAPANLIDPAALLQEAWRHAEPHWLRREATRKLELQWDVEETPKVRGQAAELREVLLNLIVNAIDAMPKGGRLTLGLDEQAGGVRFRVEDTGTGIPPEHLDRIFEPLFSTKGSGGTGLGLSVARQVAERHQGSLTVTSKEGVGSRFCLRLPGAAPGSADEEQTSACHEVAASAAGTRVLLVEGNDLVRDVMLRFLQEADLEVDTVTAMDEAQVMLDTSRAYGAVLVDASNDADSLACLFEWIRARRSDLEGRVLVYSDQRQGPVLRDLQSLYGFRFVDRSQGLEALREALSRIARPGDESQQAA